MDASIYCPCAEALPRLPLSAQRTQARNLLERTYGSLWRAAAVKRLRRSAAWIVPRFEGRIPADPEFARWVQSETGTCLFPRNTLKTTSPAKAPREAKHV